MFDAVPGFQNACITGMITELPKYLLLIGKVRKND